MNDYAYDLFISYKRHREWTVWTREHVCGLLDTYLSQELGRQPRIFIDEHIEPGADWPDRLAKALGRARILVAVFSRDYFGSAWCVHELDLMHERSCQFPDSKLIVPIIGHDGELIPNEIARIEPFNLRAFRNTDLQRNTPRYEKFADSIETLASHLVDAIASAPPCDTSWLTRCQTRFNQVYTGHCSGNPVDVETLTLKPMPFPVTPPRVVL
jgi:hypothetical protein